MQLLLASVAAAVVVWFLQEAWFPVIHQAIGQLPGQGEIHGGRLYWQGDSPLTLAEGRFLSLAVDLDHGGLARSPAHVRVEFGRSDVQVFALLGFAKASYPKGWRIAFNHQELEPWWGAWKPALLAIVAGLVVIGLILAWWLLATVYALPVWLIGFFGNRQLSLAGSWRLAGAALMPGALLLSVALFFYGLGTLDLIRLMAAAVVHLVLGWVYLSLGALAQPRIREAQDERANPFGRPKSE
jgi:hypothetical protein